MIERQQNWLGAQRVDVPHLRALGSSVASSFDLLAGDILGGGQASVIRGFTLSDPAGAIGNPAESLQLVVADSVLVHPLASEAGSVFRIAADAAVELLAAASNAKVRGSFTADAVNYVGIDLVREVDDSTVDTVMFLDPLTGAESPKTVALARTLTYYISISTIDFSTTPNICPVAIVTTDSDNNVTDIEDARQLLLRLGSGGTSPDQLASYVWPDERVDSVASTSTAFTGGDKAFGSVRDLLQGLMTRLWELGGGERWFSAVSDRDLKVIYSSPVLGNGDNFDWDLGTETLTWGSVAVTFANSTVATNDIADGSAVLTDNQCLYVDVDRSLLHDGGASPKLVPAVADLTDMGSPTVPGSRYVLAWRRGNFVFARDKDFEVNRTAVVATNLATGIVRLSKAAANPAIPLVLPIDANGVYSHTSPSAVHGAFEGTGLTTGPGVLGTGGATAGTGVEGVGGAGGGIGVKGTGAGALGAGGKFTGASGGMGAQAFGEGAGNGLEGHGGATNGSVGVVGTSSATNGDGVKGTSQGTGTGVRGVAGSAAGSGVLGSSTSAAPAIKAVGTSSGDGITVDTSGGTGVGVAITSGGTADGLSIVSGGRGINVAAKGSGAVGVLVEAGAGNAQGVLAIGSGTLHGVEGRSSSNASSAGVQGSAMDAAAAAVISKGDLRMANNAGFGTVSEAVDFSGAQSRGDHTTAVVNRLERDLTPKAWAYFRIGAAATIDQKKGVNAVPSLNAAGVAAGKIDITFPGPFVDAGSYGVACSVESDEVDSGSAISEITPLRTGKTGSVVTLLIVDGAGNPFDFGVGHVGGNHIYVFIEAKGLQT